MEKKGYIGYEYHEISIKQQKASRYLDGMQNFGWEVDDNFPITQQNGEVTLHLKRNKKILNKMELTRLQNHFEANMREIELMEKRTGDIPAIAAFGVGAMGTICMTISTFAMTHKPPMIGLSIMFAVPGFIGWGMPVFLYKKIKNKKVRELSPYLEQKYVEIDKICEKGRLLLD